MRIEVASASPEQSGSSLVALALFEGEELPAWLADAPGAADVRAEFEKTTLLRPGTPDRALVIGLGKRDDLDAERLRVAGAISAKQAQALKLSEVGWEVPDTGKELAIDVAATAITEGVILAAYRFDAYKPTDPDDPRPPELEALRINAPKGAKGVEDAVSAARVAAEAANRARELQNLPPNVMTPEYLADRASEIADANESVSAEILGPKEIAAKEMGGIVAVSAGSAREPRLIALRYDGAGKDAERVALVGKGVTFDSGGISLKPGEGMHEMKMDMSGGAAVLEATAAIAELGLAVNLITVVPAVENMPDGTATRPGDIITQFGGKTVEITNTDAEGRLILADALGWAVEQGAEKFVDLATLTGAVLTALGSTYAALISNDDAWAERVRAAGDRSGEGLWRLPLHEEYKELTRGKVADLINASSKRKAGTIYAGSFLEEFVGEKPWAHLDIAGTSWDTGRAYWGDGATGFGVRLLVQLARDLAV